MSQSVAADVELPPTPARCLSSGGPRMRERRTLLCPRGLRWRSPHETRGDGAPNPTKREAMGPLTPQRNVTLSIGLVATSLLPYLKN